ncbi:MAG: hypothetical protein AAF208_03595 [Cyanobacteria bacterium P01_A01_bin.45]
MSLSPKEMIWQGIHICMKAECLRCEKVVIEDLKIGHATNSAYQIDLKAGTVFFNGDKSKLFFKWLGQPLVHSLKNPQDKEIKISKEVFKKCQRVVILNCIDYLYGHSLLKLLNAQRHLENYPNDDLVVIIPTFLRWMVPKGVAEIWTVDIPLKKSQYFYTSFNQFVCKELERFDEVYVSKAYSHPSQFDITEFTGISKHNFEQQNFRITFIWREDRLWSYHFLFRFFRKFRILEILMLLQNWKIRRLFKRMQTQLPSAKFTITGLGQKTNFPEWIEDFRVYKFDKNTEIEMCKVYSNSRLVIGIHGSNMLLPSAHAGMTIDIMPENRWGNFAQDILYHEKDPRLAAFKYRYLPFNTSINQLEKIASSMLLKYSEFISNMFEDR